MSERSHLCAVGFALLSGKMNSFFWICCCVFLEVMGYSPRSCVILQEVDPAVVGIQVVLLPLFMAPLHIQRTDSPNDCCVSCDTGSVYGEAAITTSLTVSSFLRGKLHLD